MVGLFTLGWVHMHLGEFAAAGGTAKKAHIGMQVKLPVFSAVIWCNFTYLPI